MIAKSKSGSKLSNELIKQEHFLHLTIRVPEKVTKSDLKGNEIYYNQSCIDFTGVSKNKLVSDGWNMRVHPEDLEETEMAWSDGIKTGNKFEMELRLLDNKEEYNWYMSRTRPIQDLDGKTIQWIAITTEIQDQKQQKEKLEQIVKNRTKTLKKTFKEINVINLELVNTKEKLGSGYARIELEKGSIFSFNRKFPKTDLTVPKEEDLPEIDFGTKKIRVLVAEDVILNQLLIKTLLEGFGFDWEIAGNGKIAIEKLQSQEFDIVLMDLQMPVMDGYEATKHIRTVINSNIPIIALTADITTMDRGKCSVLGMDDYIAKPFDEKDLLNKIRKLIDPNPKKTHLTGKKTPILISDEKNERLINLGYLDRITSSDQEVMREVIATYLDETPKYLNAIILSLKNKDWKGIYHAVHKIIPSFSIVGVGPEYAAVALDIQSFSNIESKRHRIPQLVHELEDIIQRVLAELTRSISTATIDINEK